MIRKYLIALTPAQATASLRLDYVWTFTMNANYNPSPVSSSPSLAPLFVIASEYLGGECDRGHTGASSSANQRTGPVTVTNERPGQTWRHKDVIFTSHPASDWD